MTTEVVQFRQLVEDVAFLKARGVNPNDFGREAFERALRQLRANENAKELNLLKDRIRKRLNGRPAFEKSGAEMIREDRDSH